MEKTTEFSIVLLAPSPIPWQCPKQWPYIWWHCNTNEDNNMILSESKATDFLNNLFIRNLEQVLSSSWDGRPFGYNKYGPKIGGAVPFGEGELGPRLAQYCWGQGLPPCQFSSWSIQPFGYNTPTSQTDRQWDRQTGQRTDSIGRTILQTVTQKK